MSKLKVVFLDLISFGSPQARFLNLSLILLILAIVPTEYLVYSPAKSIFHTILLPIIFRGHCPDSGFFADCSWYSTGLTRATSRLLHGDIAGATAFNRLVFVLVPAMFILIMINLISSVRYYKKTGKWYRL